MLAELVPWGVTALGLAAIAGAVTLIQFFVKRHDDGREARAQRKCQHWVPVQTADGRLGVKYLFTSAPDNRNFICPRCGLVTHTLWFVDYEIQKSVREYARKAGVSGFFEVDPLDSSRHQPW